MARMSAERETVISIRGRVDRYIQLNLTQHSTLTNQLPLTTDTGRAQPPHILLGSWGNYRDVGGYEEEVHEEFTFSDFAERLASFLQRAGFEVHGNDFDPWVAGHRIHVKRMRVGFVFFSANFLFNVPAALAGTFMHYQVHLPRDSYCED